jgi:hypothetical protein
MEAEWTFSPEGTTDEFELTLAKTAADDGSSPSGSSQTLPAPRDSDGTRRYLFVDANGDYARLSIHEKFFADLPLMGYRTASLNLMQMLHNAQETYGEQQATWELTKVIHDLLQNRTS